MTDNGMKGRVKVLLGGPAQVNDPLVQGDVRSDPTNQHQALQVLTLAQRTAEEHVASARRKADTICTDARGAAEQIVRDAQARANVLKQEAEKALSDAHAKAAQVARDAQTHAKDAQRNAKEILSDAQTRADEMAKDAQANADDLMQRAQQRYEDAVGSLAAKREALQQQIETLEQFDREYRGRITAFLQNQLRALWVDQPQVNTEELEQPGAAAPVPAQERDSDHS